ncbi:MAG: 5'-nucleotidase, lipoprotein e(P4) family [Bacteroidota bacterium]
MKKYVCLLAVALFLAACGTKTTEKEKPIATKSSNEFMTLAVLYHQRAAEVKAMYYQTFNYAELVFEKDLAEKTIKEKRAVVVDIDETLLDNSPYEAKCVLANISYPEQWNEWCSLAKADALPGAVDFLKHVADSKADVYYITNRSEKLREATRNNLKAQGFPLVNDEHLLMKTDSTNKEMYRQFVAKTHHISLLMGDNLSDFSVLFDKKTVETRTHRADSLHDEFGKRFIVVPNAMYGDWEMAVYLNNTQLSEQQKDSLRKANLLGF